MVSKLGGTAPEKHKAEERKGADVTLKKYSEIQLQKQQLEIVCCSNNEGNLFWTHHWGFELIIGGVELCVDLSGWYINGWGSRNLCSATRLSSLVTSKLSHRMVAFYRAQHTMHTAVFVRHSSPLCSGPIRPNARAASAQNRPYHLGLRNFQNFYDQLYGRKRLPN